MTIVLARIDSRLIHGQVLEAWVPYCKATCIVVANNEISPVQKIVMQAAVPSKMHVYIDKISEIAEQFYHGKFADERVLLLFSSSHDALEACRLGIPVTRLNLGNMHAGPGKLRYTSTIAMNAEDIDNFQHLTESGVSISVQSVPANRETRFSKLLKRKIPEC
ncbi:MAG: PTS sugar transporter subunit IIB [Desulfuromonadales bacterium]|nr:PTS sugar transporter subunit IIB [Desulfuromonadales bacterium]MDT8423820.1 PTS sugar transporter subunit IIB [Desulfuromonadales bacterium]